MLRADSSSARYWYCCRQSYCLRGNIRRRNPSGLRKVTAERTNKNQQDSPLAHSSSAGGSPSLLRELEVSELARSLLMDSLERARREGLYRRVAEAYTPELRARDLKILRAFERLDG